MYKRQDLFCSGNGNNDGKYSNPEFDAAIELSLIHIFLHGDLGLSLRQRGRTVNQIIASKLPVSCRLAGAYYEHTL